ncbi:hypothetical protein [Pleurocapsa sp. PCC 7319]|uniref:hypothetical protein n=1 Tax=Pleurocapsa sp. PCC 7319 TaxID=118161 RepID=UPI000347CF6A|nr:hypothetical protein [Pleurocapsa sp. PCC 7319]
MDEVSEVQTVAIAEDLESLPDAATLVYLQPETVCGADDRVHVTPAKQSVLKARLLR